LKILINLNFYSILIQTFKQEGKQFVNAIFNDTINVVEPEEGLDGET
jgi:hypothetical protein